MHFNTLNAVLGLGLFLSPCMAWDTDFFSGPGYYVEAVHKGQSTDIPAAINTWYGRILDRCVAIPDAVGTNYIRCGPEQYTKAFAQGKKIKRVFVTGIDPKHFRTEAGWKAVFAGWLRGVTVSYRPGEEAQVADLIKELEANQLTTQMIEAAMGVCWDGRGNGPNPGDCHRAPKVCVKGTGNEGCKIEALIDL